MIEIYLDENLSEHVAEGLNTFNKGYFPNVTVYSTKKAIGKGVPDEEIIPVLGKSKGIFVTRDINIHKTRAQFELCYQYKLGVFFLKMPKGQNRHWDIVRLLIDSWEIMLDIIEKQKKPFGYEVPLRGKWRKLG